MEHRRYTVVAPTTGGTVWIERIRARPRLQASYAALKGDFRPLALSADYHNFVSGPLAAHGLLEGAHELLISEDIDSGRSWEIPVLIAHLLTSCGKLHVADPNDASVAEPDIIWATGSVDPELNPQGADYSVARKCELAAELFHGWNANGRRVQIIVPDGMPETDVAAVRDVAETHGFSLTIVDNFDALQSAIDLDERAALIPTAPGEPQETGPEIPLSGNMQNVPPWRTPALAATGLTVAAGAVWLALNAFSSGGSNQTAGNNGSNTSGSITEGSSPIALVRLGATNRADCIERIMLTQPMDRTTIPISDGQYRIPTTGGLCGLRFINQSSKTLTIRMTGGLVTAAIQGNDALFQGVALPANDATDLIFSRPANGLTASLQLDDAAISVVIENSEAKTQ